METRIPAIIDALLTTWAPITGARVMDGPKLAADTSDTVCVGYDSDPDGNGHAATSVQEWAGIGQRQRNEGISIVCSILCRAGDGSVSTARASAYALLDQCGHLLRADPSLGLPSPCVAELIPGEYFHTIYEDAGLFARITFTVTIKTRV